MAAGLGAFRAAGMVDSLRHGREEARENLRLGLAERGLSLQEELGRGNLELGRERLGMEAQANEAAQRQQLRTFAATQLNGLKEMAVRAVETGQRDQLIRYFQTEAGGQVLAPIQGALDAAGANINVPALLGQWLSLTPTPEQLAQNEAMKAGAVTGATKRAGLAPDIVQGETAAAASRAGAETSARLAVENSPDAIMAAARRAAAIARATDKSVEQIAAEAAAGREPISEAAIRAAATSSASREPISQAAARAGATASASREPIAEAARRAAEIARASDKSIEQIAAEAAAGEAGRFNAVTDEQLAGREGAVAAARQAAQQPELQRLLRLERNALEAGDEAAASDYRGRIDALKSSQTFDPRTRAKIETGANEGETAAAANLSRLSSLLGQVEKRPGVAGARGGAAETVGGWLGQIATFARGKEFGETVEGGITEFFADATPQEVNRFRVEARAQVSAMLPAITNENSRFSDAERKLARETARVMESEASAPQVVGALKTMMKLEMAGRIRADQTRAQFGANKLDLINNESDQLRIATELTNLGLSVEEAADFVEQMVTELKLVK